MQGINHWVNEQSGGVVGCVSHARKQSPTPSHNTPDFSGSPGAAPLHTRLDRGTGRRTTKYLKTERYSVLAPKHVALLISRTLGYPKMAQTAQCLPEVTYGPEGTYLGRLTKQRKEGTHDISAAKRIRQVDATCWLDARTLEGIVVHSSSALNVYNKTNTTHLTTITRCCHILYW